MEIKDGAKGDQGDQGPQGAKGEDGKSPEISSAENTDGSHTITIKNPNGATTSFVVKNGEKGEPGETGATGAQGPKGDKGDQGERGLQGAPGLNGKTFAPVLTKDNNGTTTIKFYPVNPETGKADTTKEAVASGEIKDGTKGDKGDQGPKGENGKSPEVSTAETKDGHTITIKNPDGSTTSFEVKNGQKGDKGDRGEAGANGKDGLAPKVTAVRNQANDGVTLTITPQSRDAKGKIVDGTPQSVDIKDGAKGEAGAQGLAGKDGLAPKVSAERNAANNGLTLTITPQIRDEKGNIVDGKPQTVEVKDG
ncbi:hypothetical protein [Aerococcus tenax]|uniref:collagen-flanked surface repeat-containing protein n=1 Tax=Aerococcus tenax TaxID=3078812 RepID=UPI00398EB8EF